MADYTINTTIFISVDSRQGNSLGVEVSRNTLLQLGESVLTEQSSPPGQQLLSGRAQHKLIQFVFLKQTVRAAG